MDIPDDMLLRMVRLDPVCVPITKIGRCLRITQGSDRDKILASITKRRPRNDRERQSLLALSLATGVGGIAFVDSLSGFEGLTRC